MPATSDTPAPRPLSEHLDLGVLAACYPRDVIEDVLARTGATEQRRRSLPAHVVLRHTIAWGLDPTRSTGAVMRQVAGSLQMLGSWEQDWKIPSTSAISQARQRLGPEPLAALFRRTCTPMATATTPGAFIGAWRLMSLDGTTLDVADTQANTDHFGHGGNLRSRSVHPQLRLVTLAEIGTQAIVGAAMGPCLVSEGALAQDLGPLCEPGMLVLADAGFHSWTMWTDYAGTGADLAWRAGPQPELPMVRPLADGSYLALLFAPRVSRKTKDGLLAQARAGQGVNPERASVVRAVDYTVPEAGPEGELITVMTTVLDPARINARELAAVHGRRRENPTVLDQVKTRVLGAGTVLASQSPSMVTAQVWGVLLAHYAVRELIHRSAEQVGVAPDRSGSTHAVRIVRRTAQDAVRGAQSAASFGPAIHRS